MEITVGPAYWPVLGWTALLAFAQTVLAPVLAFRGAVPSLVTIAVVLYAARAGARRGVFLALPAGLLEDVFAGTGGGWAISTTVVALLGINEAHDWNEFVAAMKIFVVPSQNFVYADVDGHIGARC